MPTDWSVDDRRAIRYIVVWGGFLFLTGIVRGMIKEYGGSQPIIMLTLSAAWIVLGISAIIWTLRQRKRRDRAA